jgi:hypothetical protein
MPAGQVRGAGQDVEQAALRQPLMDRLLERDRRGAAFAAAAGGEHRVAVYDPQIGVGLEPRVRRFGSIRQLLPEMRLQVIRVGGDPGLLAELRQAWLAVLPRQQLRGEVGVGVRAHHGDVAGPQLRGEVGEHAHLQVPARHHPRLVLVPQHLSPRV